MDGMIISHFPQINIEYTASTDRGTSSGTANQIHASGNFHLLSPSVCLSLIPDLF